MAPSTDALIDGGGFGSNNAVKFGGAGSGAGASTGAGADAVGGDGPSTTMDEDLALVSFIVFMSYDMVVEIIRIRIAIAHFLFFLIRLPIYMFSCDR